MHFRLRFPSGASERGLGAPSSPFVDASVYEEESF